MILIKQSLLWVFSIVGTEWHGSQWDGWLDNKMGFGGSGVGVRLCTRREKEM